ncbi:MULTISPECIES: YggS family pyridoxal phosphate-dependent enzyme [Subtercola]|uniref:Pyridoxal phosphate homeostasis protein n=1 Tax=Subtercola vilae TaxID=2056433 RepID=A0A4T2BXU5_9MICO|nr:MULTISPECIES: YggS family pyridoxal phosphate-dependent enzyme [Subtercola]MEA9983903.1 YggS family pyridoxal phosphate-dependent enzyme [Subtercola sp. RTI3]TIH34448.1 YggS family pyridoxal phosphate-dependent enzyme [Subtercola vilae]
MSSNEGGPGLAERLALVRQQIGEAASAADRSSDELTLIAITKFHDESLLRELAALGVRDFGESRHQEARDKAANLADLDLTWHFVGQIQSKKARQIAAYSAVIHSLDRASVADLLGTTLSSSPETVLKAAASASDARPPVDVFIQVNLTPDPARGGATPGDLEALAEHVSGLAGLRLRGVMAVAPLGEPARPAFERLRLLSAAVQRIDAGASAISAGMSNDFADAIAEGATHLRIGSAITGFRPVQR